MPIVELDDGTEVEFPDDMSGDEIKAVLDKQYAAQEPQEYLLPGGVKPQNEAQARYAKSLAESQKQREGMTGAEVIASDPGYRMLYGGVTEPILGLSQVAAKYLVDPFLSVAGLPEIAPQINETLNRNRQIEEAGRRKLGEDVEGIDPWKLAGGVAVPVNIASKLKVGKSLLDRMATGAATGAAYSTSMPVYGEDQERLAETKGEQMLGGGVVGFGIPALTTVGGKVAGYVSDIADQLVRPFSRGGIEKDIRDLLIEQVGPQRAKVIEAMMLADKNMTASQALAKYTQETGETVGAGVSRLEKELSKQSSTGAPLRSQYEAQKKAREAIINKLAGTEDDGITPYMLQKQAGVAEDMVNISDDMPKIFQKQAGGLPVYEADMIADPLERAKFIREIESNKLYDDAFNYPVKRIGATVIEPGVKIPGDEQLTSIVKNPYFEQAMPSIRRLNEVDGVTPATNITKYLHNAKLALDGMLEKQGETALSRAEKGKVVELKSQIVAYLGKINPVYDEARRTFGELSKPINQMEVGRYLSEKLTSPTGMEAPGTFLRTMSDAPKTLKTATGYRYNELGDILEPDQLSGVEKVVKELERQALSNKAAGEVTSVLPKLESGIEITLPNMLSRPALVANAVLRNIGKTKAPEYNRIATEIVQNPQRLAELLQKQDEEGLIARQIYSDILPMIAGQTTGRETGE